jgi:hypothetical protein
VLAERHNWLRTLALSELRDPTRYWEKMQQWPAVGHPVPTEVNQLLARAMPEPGLAFQVRHRQAGLGSLGRRRFTATIEWRGGFIAREAKELASSAWHWATPGTSASVRYQEALDHAVRVADPCVSVHKHWLLRRLAPDCSRIELASLPKARDELRLLHAMGWETANIHLGSADAIPAILRHLPRQPADWLQKAAAAMAEATLKDWKDWRSR